MLATYEIVAAIGSGGMGEVYRARDTKLNRDVALKVLPDLFASDPDRLARFRREAQVLASLNHPNIAAIYGLEEADGIQAIVLELVEGDTLADRISHGPIPLDDAMPIARQIAEALEAAHQRDIIHRDLKPANVKIRPDGAVKVLDFGLAKALDPRRTDFSPAVDLSLSQSPTITSPAMLTGVGVLLGTAAYMSPEQAKGRPADKRSDIWAFGCVLYEMLTGRRPFDGDDVADLLARVIEGQPNFTALPPAIPPAIRRLVRRCVEKDRNRRLPDIGVARLEIDEALTTPAGVEAGPTTPPKRAARERLLWAAGIVAMGIAAATAGWYVRAVPADVSEMRLHINTPPGNPANFAFSPDGRSVVFQATTQGRTQLWLRPLASEEALALGETDGAFYPFWSPDSRSIGFFADQKLKRIDIASGTVRSIADASWGFNGASWNSDGVILFVPANSGPLYRVASDGGDPLAVTRLESPRQLAHRFPQFLPDGRHFVYWVSGTPEVNGVYVGDLESGTSSRVLEADMFAGFAPPDYLLYVRRETLFAQRLDSRTFQITGSPFAVSERVGQDSDIVLRAAVSASTTGPLAYRAAPSLHRHMVWLDRMGKQTAEVGEFDTGAAGAEFRVSPDGQLIGLSRRVSGQTDIWVMERARGLLRRVTSDVRHDGDPVWSPDGAHIAFSSNPRGIRDLYQIPVSGGRTQEALLESAENKNPLDWSADGRFILYSSISPNTSRDLWVLPLEGDRKPFAIAQTRYEETQGRFSPDRRWVAYTSNETGRNEVYVRPFPGPGPSVQVSTNGGTDAQWRSDTRELFYVEPGLRLMAVPVIVSNDGQRIEAGPPAGLFTLGLDDAYSPSPDGQRFLVNTERDNRTTPPITILLNWAGTRTAR